MKENLDRKMKQMAFYELFERTAFGDQWVGTGPRATAKKYDLWADPASLMYGDEALCVDGWACRAEPAPSRLR
jgi:hypothetical protein